MGCVSPTTLGTGVVLLDLAAGQCSSFLGFAKCAWPRSDMHAPSVRWNQARISYIVTPRSKERKRNRKHLLRMASKQQWIEQQVVYLLWRPLTDTRHLWVPLSIAAARNSHSLIAIESGVAGDITCGVSRGRTCFLCQLGVGLPWLPALNARLNAGQLQTDKDLDHW